MSCGRKVTVDRPPERAIALEQGATEVMLSLGLADRMIGTSYRTDPVLPELAAAYASVPVLAEQYPAPEVVRAQEPDFLYSMLSSAFTSEVAGERSELEGLGISAYLAETDCEDPALTPRFDFDVLFSQVQDIADLFGVPDRGRQLVAEQRQALDQAVASTPKRPERPTVLWFYSTYDGAPYVAGPGGVPARMSEVLGMTNVFADAGSKWPEVSWEEIADRNPDVIVIADSERGRPGDSADDKRQYLRTDPVTSRLGAVLADRLVEMPASAMDPSIRNVRAVAALSDALTAMDLDT